MQTNSHSNSSFKCILFTRLRNLSAKARPIPEVPPVNESPRRRAARYLKSNFVLYAASGEELTLKPPSAD
jgi:hypothetical protein